MKKSFFIILVTLYTNVAFSQWTPDTRLTYDPYASETTFHDRSIDVNGDEVHIVWLDRRNYTNGEIYYKHSYDGGITWEPDSRLSFTSDYVYKHYPTISVAGSYVHITWCQDPTGNNDFGIYYLRSTDGGATWDPIVRLTDFAFMSYYPTIANYDQEVYVAYQVATNVGYKIYFRHSTDNGNTWGPATIVPTNPASAQDPSMEVYGSQVHLVYWSYYNDKGTIFYIRSSDAGVTWGPSTRLSYNSTYAYEPLISLSGTDVYVTWESNHINFIKSVDNGLTWGVEMIIPTTNQYIYGYGLDSEGSMVCMTWRSYVNNLGAYEIFFTRSMDGGLNWESNTRLTYSYTHKTCPSLSVSGQQVHVIWSDGRDGNSEIYYKRTQISVTAIAISSYNSYNISCIGGSDGSAEAFPAGGLAPYTYLWDDPAGQTTKLATGLHAGTYTVIVTDADGSIATATCTLTEPAPLLIEAGLNQTVYFGYTPASCAILEWSGASGGVPPYFIAWSTGQTTQTITVCPAVTTDYTVTITDANNCVFSDQVKVCVIDVRCGNNLNKVQICHIPTGNPGNPQTLCVAASAVPDHLAHGDMLGACGIDRSCTEVKSGIVAEFIAEVNYRENSLKANPNPFSENLTITFSCLAGGKATLKLIDFTGKEVARPFENYIERNITYQVEFNGSSLSPGLYFCVLNFPDGTIKSIKLLLSN